MTKTTTAPIKTSAQTTPAWHLQSLLRLADDALILAERIAEWTGHGPVLEEELAMANIGLDLLGQARLLYTHAGQLEGKGRDEDKFAYFREGHEFFNHALMELPNARNGHAKHEDYAITIARNFLHSARMVPTWQALTESKDDQLAAIAGKAIKESVGHLRHSRDWMIRLGDGTEESQTRMQQALERLWPYTHELWADDETDKAAAQAGVIVLPSSIKSQWDEQVDQTLAQATLKRPEDSGFLSTGKQGQHTEYLSYMLAEMQSLARAHPDAQW